MGYKEDVEDKWNFFVISDDYRWTLLVTLLMVVHYYTLVGMAGGSRKVFTEEFMKENFGDEHKQALNGDEIKKGGYPDSGSGRYTMALGYKGWMEFNKLQRSHYNYLESISQILCMMLTCGLEFPITTAIIGGVYLLGRIIFQVGYKISPKARMIGVPFVMLTQFFLPIFTIYSLSQMYSNRCADAECLSKRMMDLVSTE
eukprot:CAMPEP_0168618462 /NCGR_PEP_ID=MMETSP0449_2-20121227/6085_1 /TAXON_ID=1082188 /ORGANISM="Strombidium rassoulzadegani, Strain ras09" /LENGTH=199 /DNA_ID=CAMNT_0008659339 /DNA_START=195 /DNA_END=794 /DNA_ORIENTATION=+